MRTQCADVTFPMLRFSHVPAHSLAQVYQPTANCARDRVNGAGMYGERCNRAEL